MPYHANEFCDDEVTKKKKRIVVDDSDLNNYDRIKDAKLDPFYYQRRYNTCPRCGMSNCKRNH